MSVLRAAVTGAYETRGSIDDGDCVLAQSFGAGKDSPGYNNEQLAEYIAADARLRTLPLILQQEVADAYAGLAEESLFRIQGNPSTAWGSELESWEVLRQGGEIMREQGLRRPVLVAQAYHVGRLTMQSIKRGMDPIVPPDLPRDFDPESTQIWTRSKYFWVPREVVGMGYLLARGKL